MLVKFLRTELPTKTSSECLVNGNHFGWVLEDPVRDGKPFVLGDTAIPYGRYRLIVSFSNRFKKRMIQIVNVRGSKITFHGVSVDACGLRIHGGNTTKDSLGCPLLGAKKQPNGDVYDCKTINEQLLSMVEEHDKFEEVYLDVARA